MVGVVSQGFSFRRDAVHLRNFQVFAQTRVIAHLVPACDSGEQFGGGGMERESPAIAISNLAVAGDKPATTSNL